MSKLTRLLTTTALTLALASPAFAQTTTSPQTGQQQPPAASDESKTDSGAPKSEAQSAPSTSSSATAMDKEPAAQFPITEQSAEQAMASELIGTPVMGPDGAEYGEIADLILDDQKGIVGAVVAVGGFLGIGSKRVGVPWQSLQVQTAEGRTVATLDLTEQELADAAAFKTQEEIQDEAEAARAPSASPATPPTTSTQ